jgi:hypothetical protein
MRRGRYQQMKVIGAHTPRKVDPVGRNAPVVRGRITGEKSLTTKK